MGCPLKGVSTLPPPPTLHPRREIHSKTNHTILGSLCPTITRPCGKGGSREWGEI